MVKSADRIGTVRALIEARSLPALKGALLLTFDERRESRCMSATPIILPATTDKDEVIDVDASPVAEDNINVVSAIAAAKPFSGLSDAIVEAVAESAVARKYSAGQTVFSMGQFDGADIIVVARGQMRVSVIDAETGSIVVDDLAPKSAFAIDLTFCGAENSVFSRLAVTAEDDLSLVFVEAEALRALAGQRPSLMRNIAHYFAEELGARRFNATTAQAAPQQRVFAQLLKFIERDNVLGVWRVPQMPKHRELADLAGVEESIAAGAVATLIQEGVAQRDYPGLVVNDMSRLNELAG